MNPKACGETWNDKIYLCKMFMEINSQSFLLLKKNKPHKPIYIWLLKIKNTATAVGEKIQLIKVLVHPHIAFHYLLRSNGIVGGRMSGLGHYPPSSTGWWYSGKGPPRQTDGSWRRQPWIEAKVTVTGLWGVTLWPELYLNQAFWCLWVSVGGKL